MFTIKIMLICCTLAGVSLALPLATLLFVPDAAPSGSKADLIMVFPGAPNRVTTGFSLAQNGSAAKLAISGLGTQDLETLAVQFGKPAGIEYLRSAKSRSTFEDVFNTREIVRRNGIHSVLLVTSGWHAPRSYFLLKCFLLGSGVTIRVATVDDPHTPAGGKTARTLRTKLIINEAVKCWGSMAEMTWSLLTGTLLLDIPRFHEFSGYLKRKILFTDL